MLAIQCTDRKCVSTKWHYNLPRFYCRIRLIWAEVFRSLVQFHIANRPIQIRSVPYGPSIELRPAMCVSNRTALKMTVVSRTAPVNQKHPILSDGSPGFTPKFRKISHSLSHNANAAIHALTCVLPTLTQSESIRSVDLPLIRTDASASASNTWKSSAGNRIEFITLP